MSRRGATHSKALTEGGTRGSRFVGVKTRLERDRPKLVEVRAQLRVSQNAICF